MTTRSLTVHRQPHEALRDFSPVEKLLLFGEIAAAYVHVRVLLRHGDVRSALAAIRAIRPTHAAPGEERVLEFAGRLGAVVDGRLRHLPGDTRCLTRSLVLMHMLSRRGLARSVVVIGVRAKPKFGAHAWVELDGQTLNQPMEATGSRMVEL